jgi:hypothetical protein
MPQILMSLSALPVIINALSSEMSSEFTGSYK